MPNAMWEASIERSILINAPTAKVWAALTEPELMNKWMGEMELQIETDWKQGSPILIRGTMYKKPFENKGTVLACEPGKHLCYSHLSSLSRLPDVPENYTVLDFALNDRDGQTQLEINISNFPTETIYKHLVFYWNVAPMLLKKLVEKTPNP